MEEEGGEVAGEVGGEAVVESGVSPLIVSQCCLTITKINVLVS